MPERHHVASLLMLAATPAAAQLCVDAGPVQMTWEHRYAENTPPDEIPFVDLLVAIDDYLSGDCENYRIDLLGFSTSHVNGTDTFGWPSSIEGAVKAGLSLVPSVPGLPVPDPLDIDCFGIDTVVEYSGSLDGYIIQGGTTSWPDVRIGKGAVSFCDDVVVQGVTEPTVIEVPYGIGAGLVAGEGAFATPVETFARCTVKLTGSVNGSTVVNEEQTIESVTAIPETGSISASGVIPIALSADATVTIDVTAEVEIHLEAKSGGIFGSIVGSATAGISLDGSGLVAGAPGFYVGNFTGEGGGPLPDGIAIFSDRSGVQYAGPRANPIASVRWSELKTSF